MRGADTMRPRCFLLATVMAAAFALLCGCPEARAANGAAERPASKVLTKRLGKLPYLPIPNG